MRSALVPLALVLAVMGCGRAGCSRRSEPAPPSYDVARTALANFRDELSRARTPEQKLELARAIVQQSAIEDATFRATGDVYQHYTQPEPPESCLADRTCFASNARFIRDAERRAYAASLPADVDARAKALVPALQVPALEAELDRRARYAAEQLPLVKNIAYRGDSGAPRTVYLALTGHALEAQRDAALERVLDSHPGKLRVGVIARADAAPILESLGHRLTTVALIDGELRLDVVDEEQWLEQLFPGEAFPPSKPRPFGLALIDGHAHVVDRGVPRLRDIVADEGLGGVVVAALPGPTPEKIKLTNEVVLGALREEAPFLWPLGAVDETASDAPAQWQTLSARGAHGLKLLTGHDDFHRARGRPVLDPPPLRATLQVLEQRGVPVLWHVNTHLYPDGFLRVLADYPKLVVINPHLGGYLGYAPQLLRTLLTRYPNLHVDLSFGTQIAYLRHSFEDLSARRDEWRKLMIEMPERFIYGADMVVAESTSRAHGRMLHRMYRALLEDESFDFRYFPARGFATLRDASQYHPNMRGLALPREVLERIYSGNALRIYAKKAP